MPLETAGGYARVFGERRNLVDTSAGFRERLIETHGGETHSHGRAGERSHAGTAFTTWLDFSRASEQARAVRDALFRRMRNRKTPLPPILQPSSAASSTPMPG